MNASMSLWGHWRRTEPAAAKPIFGHFEDGQPSNEKGAADGIFSRRSSGVSSDLAVQELRYFVQ